jgi:hypothetical protein
MVPIVSVVVAERIRSGNLDAWQEPYTIAIAILVYPDWAEEPLQCYGDEVSKVCIDTAYWISSKPEHKYNARTLLPRRHVGDGRKKVLIVEFGDPNKKASEPVDDAARV